MDLSYRTIKPTNLTFDLVQAWRRIQSDNQAYQSPYFCPDFTQLVGGVREDVGIVVLERSGNPVGFFPFQRSFLGVGRPVGGPLSDYHAVIAEQGCTWELLPLMRAARLHVWDFDHLIGNPAQFKNHVKEEDISPQIDLSGGYEQYVKDRNDSGSSYIKKTEGLARKLGREVGDVTFTFHEYDGVALEKLMSWKSEQYRRSNLVDGFSVLWTRDLLRRILQTQTTDFAGVCSVLRSGNQIIAVHMGMRSRTTLHYWFPAYDQNFSKFSPGILLLLRTAQALDNLNVNIIDLGKGDSHYKQRLMNSSVFLQKGAVELPSWITTFRHKRKMANALAAQGGIAGFLQFPLRALNRIERLCKFK